MIVSSDFKECISILRTIVALENDEKMKQIRSSICHGSVKTVSYDDLSITMKSHIKSVQDKILDKQNGLGIVNGGDVSLSMQMRIRKYEKLKKNLEILRSSCITEKYFDNCSPSEFYTKCTTSISEEIKIATKSIAKEIETPSAKSLRNINHLFSNLTALATVGVFSRSIMDHKNHIALKRYVSTVKEKVMVKLQVMAQDAVKCFIYCCLIHF